MSYKLLNHLPCCLRYKTHGVIQGQDNTTTLNSRCVPHGGGTCRGPVDKRNTKSIYHKDLNTSPVQDSGGNDPSETSRSVSLPGSYTPLARPTELRGGWGNSSSLRESTAQNPLQKEGVTKRKTKVKKSG